MMIKLGDSDVEYNPDFRFYMTTTLPNPHFLPEVFIKVNVINFTVTRLGLEDQLLGYVVRKERPELEEQKDRLVVSISNDKRQLKVRGAFALAARRPCLRQLSAGNRDCGDHRALLPGPGGQDPEAVGGEHGEHPG